MKKISWIYFLLVAGILPPSCGARDARSPAIRDFRSSLQPYLIKAVSTGVFGFDQATVFIEKHATDNELEMLSRSEHPILRAIAFREMQTRPGFDHFALIMNHLDDTATVAEDHGEWGIRFRKISDLIVENGKWKTVDDKNRTIDKIITKHNYLSSAYSIVSRIEKQDKYYPFIKEMAVRESLLEENDRMERPFEEIESALYALACYQKKEDIPLIQQMFLSNISRMRSQAFELMEAYPDTSYLEVLRKYAKRQLYRLICQERSTTAAEAFIKAIAVYKSDSSARILNTILSRKPFMPCQADTATLQDVLIRSIWANPCPAYSKLREQIKGEAEKRIKWDTESVLGGTLPVLDFKDTTPAPSEPVRWW